MIELSHVYKVYSNNVHALSNVSFKIAKGDFVYLTGPSGAGKTTLFKLITCYDQPTSGEIKVGGVDLTNLPAGEIPFIRRKIGVVFQDFKLLKNRTVYENVALPLEIMKIKSSEVLSRVIDILDQVGLKYKASYYPEELSGGEQQRVAIARAVISKPGLLIADEPTGNLDQNLSSEIMELFSKINAQGTTVFVATHNPQFISKGNRRVIHLESGLIAQNQQEKSKSLISSDKELVAEL